MNIDWNLLLAQVGGTTAIVAAIAWLTRFVIQRGFSLELETHKANLRNQVDSAIEALRIHDKDRTQAHKRLFAFANRVRNETFPMAEDKERGFERVMASDYWGKLQLDQIYFSDRAAEILAHFEGMYTCMNRGELADNNADEVRRFFDKQVFAQSQELSTYARSATHALRTAVQQSNAAAAAPRRR